MTSRHHQGTLGRNWSKNQVREFVKEARGHLGKGWDYLVPEVQIAVIRSQALRILQRQSCNQIPASNIDWLVSAMLEEAGFSEGA